MNGVDCGDWIFGGLVHLQMPKVIVLVIRQEQRNQSSLFRENVFRKLGFFFKVKATQKGDQDLKVHHLTRTSSSPPKRTVNESVRTGASESCTMPHPWHSVLWPPICLLHPHVYEHLTSRSIMKRNSPGPESASAVSNAFSSAQIFWNLQPWYFRIAFIDRKEGRKVQETSISNLKHYFCIKSDAAVLTKENVRSGWILKRKLRMADTFLAFWSASD